MNYSKIKVGMRVRVPETADFIKVDNLVGTVRHILDSRNVGIEFDDIKGTSDFYFHSLGGRTNRRNGRYVHHSEIEPIDYKSYNIEQLCKKQ